MVAASRAVESLSQCNGEISKTRVATRWQDQLESRYIAASSARVPQHGSFICQSAATWQLHPPECHNIAASSAKVKCPNMAASSATMQQHSIFIGQSATLWQLHPPECRNMAASSSRVLQYGSFICQSVATWKPYSPQLYIINDLL